MEGVCDADFRRVIEFIEEAWAFAGDQPFTRGTLDALERLIPCDVLAYSELDRVDRHEIAYVGTDGDGGDLELFWRIVDQHPICRHQQAYADFSAVRLSDVTSPRGLSRMAIYADYFRPNEIAAELEVGISRSRVRTRSFVLDRASGDFSVRDRAVLELVRPHLARIHETTCLRRTAGVLMPGEVGSLTTREAEVVELVACGLTNAAIAERLWISPGTVKKHLDNIYAKLGVANRTAAAVRVGGQRAGNQRSSKPSTGERRR